MADIQVTDQLDKPIASIKVDLSNPSSLLKYLKTEALHLAVGPDFLARKDSVLSQAATKPIQFEGKAQHKFQLGNVKPEIDFTPGADVTIRVNASPGTNLFDGDAYQLAATVPPKTGYVSVRFTGSLDLGVCGTEGDLTFGLDTAATANFEYLKAFPLGAGEPTLGEALRQVLSSYVIPADISDLQLLGINDAATVSGQGSIKISGGIKASLSPNPLASAALPLGAGTIAVHAGGCLGLSASFAITGSYQIRLLRKNADTIQLSISPERGTTWKADFSASAGVTAEIGETDLLAAMMGAISTDPTKDQKALAGLQPSEIKTLNDAIKTGLDHNLQASLDTILSGATDDLAAFQYEIQPAKLSPEANLAVHKALDGDLSRLTALETEMQEGGILAPGLKMINSVLSETRKRGITLKVNLLGILNYLTVSELIRHSEVLTDTVTGDVTIKETVTGNNISAMVNPLDRAEALRKAMFDSVLTTTAYRAGKAVALPDLSCEQVHFAFSQSTKQQTMKDYLNWFVALNLLSAPDEQIILAKFMGGGKSNCVLRTSFTDAECAAMFFDANGNLRQKQDYLNIGRRALRALLDPQDNQNDGLRFRIVDDGLWPQALSIGASSNLGPLVGLSTEDPRVEYLIGDVRDIKHWADTMTEAGARVQEMRNFVGNSDLNTLLENNQFKSKRNALQTTLASMVKASKTRFDEPWGMVCLFWAAGSPPRAYGKAVAQNLTVEKGAQVALAAAATATKRRTL